MSVGEVGNGPVSLVFDTNSGVDEPSIPGTVDLIRELYGGHNDQNEQPISAHAIRVSKNVRLLDPDASEDAVKAALLHDVTEECGLSLDDLQAKQFSDETVEAVGIVSRPPGDRRPHAEFVQGIIDSGNRDAMLVKLADAIDNGNKHRLALVRDVDPDKAERLEQKYDSAILALSSALAIDHKFCVELTERNIAMDEEFEGVKFYLLDGRPVKAVWEDGIVEEVYEVSRQTAQVQRNDALAHYVMYDLSSSDEINADEYGQHLAQLSGQDLE